MVLSLSWTGSYFFPTSRESKQKESPLKNKKLTFPYGEISFYKSFNKQTSHSTDFRYILKNRNGKKAKLMITIAAKNIDVDKDQWFILKIAKTIKSSTPINPNMYFNLSLVDLVNSLL